MRKILDAIEKEQQGFVFDPGRKIARQTEIAERERIAPIGSEFTRARGHGLEDGTDVTYDDYERVRQAMEDTGMVGSPVQFWQALTMLGVVGLENGRPDQKLHPVMTQPVSRREAQLRHTIDRYIKSTAPGNADKQRDVRREAKFIFGPIGDLNYDQLREQFAWLQRKYPGGVIYEDRHQTA
jgi:hypothetical protein